MCGPEPQNQFLRFLNRLPETASFLITDGSVSNSLESLEHLCNVTCVSSSAIGTTTNSSLEK